MRTFAVVVVAALAFAAVAQARVPADDMSLFSNEANVMPQTVSSQRALQQAKPYPAYYSPPVCIYGELPAQIVAKVAILQYAKKTGDFTNVAYGIRLYTRALYLAYRAQNKFWGTNLKYSVKNYINPGVVTNPAQYGKSTQAWFYYYIVLDIGQCGPWKADFIRILRNTIRKPRPGGSQVKRLRVIKY